MFQISPSSYERDTYPLALLDPNTCSCFSLQIASAAHANGDKSKYLGDRATRYPHMQHTFIEEQDRRRQKFLKKVRQVSDDKKWESRSAQILRNDFFSRQKEWEDDQARSAPEDPQILDDDEQEVGSISTGEVEMVDQILLQENREFEALVASMQDHAEEEDQSQQDTFSHYGSDEDEYDQLFIEVMSRQRSTEEGADAGGESATEQDQDMDMSMG
ncbi:hypothetical protein BDR22DRAFT_61496 [Usnea florida]